MVFGLGAGCEGAMRILLRAQARRRPGSRWKPWQAATDSGTHATLAT